MPNKNGTNSKRASGGRFAKGASGNPKGRPQGSRNKSTQLLEALEADFDRQADNLCKLALAGNPTALKLLWERVLPRPTGRRVEFELPRFDNGHDFAAALIDVLRDVGAGKLTPAEGTQIADLIERAERSDSRSEDRLAQEAGNVCWTDQLMYQRLTNPEEFKKYHEAGLSPGSDEVMKMDPPKEPGELLYRCQRYYDASRRYVKSRGLRNPDRPDRLRKKLEISYELEREAWERAEAAVKAEAAEKAKAAKQAKAAKKLAEEEEEAA